MIMNNSCEKIDEIARRIVPILRRGEVTEASIFGSTAQGDDNLQSEKQRRAVEAFRGGYISIGKLAEEMGMHVWHLQKWLEEHDDSQNNTFSEDDVKNT